MTFVLLGLMFIGMLLETFGLSLIVPALSFMTQADFDVANPKLQLLLNSIGNPTREQLVIIGMLVFAGVYTIKVLFMVFFTWWQARFIFRLQADLSHRLFAGYLHMPYTFHLQRNSAQLIHNATAEVGMFTKSVQSILGILTETSIFLGISILLLYMEPSGALIVVATIGIAGCMISVMTKGLVLRWGEARQVHEGQRIQHLQQGLGSTKEVKLLGREKEFIDQYQIHNIGSAKVSQGWFTIQALPRLWLELLAVFGLVVLVFVMIERGKPMDSLLPILALFAAAAFRIMPSVSRVIGSFQGIRYALPAINKLFDEFSLFEKAESIKSNEEFPFNREITLSNVSFSYEKTESNALNNVSFSIPFGTTVGLVGTTGAGKSTLIDIILGLLPPKNGSIKVDGIDIHTNLRGWQDKIGYVPQTIYLTDDTLRRNVAFGLSDKEIDDTAVNKALSAAHMDSFLKSQPHGLDSVVGERGIRLSGGQRQRIGIARALYHDPSILVLDEATSSLDNETEATVMDAVRDLKGNKTIIIVAHRLSTVEHSDWLYRLEHGMIVEEGKPETILYKREK